MTTSIERPPAADEPDAGRAPAPRRSVVSLLTRPLEPAGALFSFAVEVMRAMFRRPFQTREFLDQAWFVVKVSIVPACFITIPFGATFSLQIGSLFKQLGGEAYIGAAAVLANVQQVAPVVTASIVAGAGGTAVCADLGSRKIREELDAMKVLGISPIQRLVVPRVLAMVFVAVLLNVVVALVGILGSFVYAIYVQGGSAGAFLQSATALAQMPDLYVGEVKAALFGLLAGIIAAYRGVNAAGGPRGVGDSVNQSVIIAFVLLFIVNTVITGIYYQLVPPKGV